MKRKEDFWSPKDLELAKSIILSLIETAIIHKKINLDDLKTIEKLKLKDILLDIVKDCSDNKGDMRHTLVYTDEILKEANDFKLKGKYRLAIVLYATVIEHLLNDIIQQSLINKKFTAKEIEAIMRLDIESKRTWLFPLLGLPRLSINCSKNIKDIADKRNEFIHYKWKGLFDAEYKKIDEKYKDLCKKSLITISIIKRYKTNNLITINKIKKYIKNSKTLNL